MSGRLNKVARWMLPATVVTTLAAAGVAVTSKRSADTRLQNVADAVEELQYSLEGLRGSDAVPVVERTRRELHQTADVAGTLADLERLAVDLGIELTTLETTSTTQAAARSFVIRGLCTPSALCDLMAAIEAHDRLMVVGEGVVQAAAEQLLQFGVTIQTYHQAGAHR